MGCISQGTYLLISWYCMVLHGIELQHTEFHCISLYSIVLHGIAWFCFVLHGIVCLTMCSITYFWYVKLWGLPRRVFTLFFLLLCGLPNSWAVNFISPLNHDDRYEIPSKCLFCWFACFTMWFDTALIWALLIMQSTMMVQRLLVTRDRGQQHRQAWHGHTHCPRHPRMMSMINPHLTHPQMSDVWV